MHVAVRRTSLAHKVLFLSVAKYADLHRHMTEIHIVDCDKPFNLAFPGKFTNQS